MLIHTNFENMTLSTLRTKNGFAFFFFFFNGSFLSNLCPVYGGFCEKHNDCKSQNVPDRALLYTYKYRKEVVFHKTHNLSSLEHWENKWDIFWGLINQNWLSYIWETSMICAGDRCRRMHMCLPPSYMIIRCWPDNLILRDMILVWWFDLTEYTCY